ncbi:MAG: glutaconate CoA-transferase [Syntrophales bacterium]|nr:glutaconate CoA-transferase [Syntrophales bacterium]
MEYTRQEMMAIATGREIRDNDLCIFGVGLSMLAGYFALAHHAPNAKALTEGGVYGSTPVGGLPWGIEDNRISANATSFTGALDALGFMVASGRCDLGIIGAAQIDKFGNVNTTGFWENPRDLHFGLPKIRLNGSGGANEIGCGCKRVIIMAAHEKKRFAEKVDYVTTPGYLDGGGARAKYHFVGGGPSAVITTLGILKPDPDLKELIIDSYFAFSSVEEMKRNTGWELKVSSRVAVTSEPTSRELEVLRLVDVTGMLRKK